MKRLPSLAIALIAIAASACSSTQEVLEPSAIASTPPPSPAAMPPATAAAAAPVALRPGQAAGTRLHFDPIVGATVEIAGPLTERLAQKVKAKGIALSGSDDPSTTHVLKGYFSTLTEGGQTTVIYVWDVYDVAGNRLHRINGQQKAPAGAREGWAAVPPATVQAIADSTVDQFTSWLATSSG